MRAVAENPAPVPLTISFLLRAQRTESLGAVPLPKSSYIFRGIRLYTPAPAELFEYKTL